MKIKTTRRKKKTNKKNNKENGKTRNKIIKNRRKTNEKNYQTGKKKIKRRNNQRCGGVIRNNSVRYKVINQKISTQLITSLFAAILFSFDFPSASFFLFNFLSFLLV